MISLLSYKFFFNERFIRNPRGLFILIIDNGEKLMQGVER